MYVSIIINGLFWIRMHRRPVWQGSTLSCVALCYRMGIVMDAVCNLCRSCGFFRRWQRFFGKGDYHVSQSHLYCEGVLALPWRANRTASARAVCGHISLNWITLTSGLSLKLHEFYEISISNSGPQKLNEKKYITIIECLKTCLYLKIICKFYRLT